MARPIRLDIDPMNVDDNGLAEDQQPAASGAQNFNLNGALLTAAEQTAGIFTERYALGGKKAPWGRRLICTTTGNESARTFTFTGTDADGRPVTETMAGPNAGTDETTEYFQTITSIATDDDTAANVKFGTVDEIRTSTLILDHYANKGAAVNVIVTGTINFDVKESFQNVHESYKTAATKQSDLLFTDIVLGDQGNTIDFAAITASAGDTIRRGVTALYLEVNSYTNTAELLLDVVQSMRGA